MVSHGNYNVKVEYLCSIYRGTDSNILFYSIKSLYILMLLKSSGEWRLLKNTDEHYRTLERIKFYEQEENYTKVNELIMKLHSKSLHVPSLIRLFNDEDVYSTLCRTTGSCTW
jgi:hypothetical protein